MFKTALVTALAANAFNFAIAECPNACNGHGQCTSYDMCDCNRNWQANDCSERVCQYGLAHVDTPKGDLNHDNTIEGPDLILVENSPKYPFGTTEQFPRMQDSDLATLDNTAHYYMECSNKGSCNRETGTCECFPGYDGAACQRASCPGYPESCSGHGVCKTIRQLANADSGNVYELWDRDVTMGCECDKGFFGPDCSLRECKYGVDPLYLDDTATIKYSVFDFAVLTTGTSARFTDGMDTSSNAKFAIVFYDMHGESWRTRPITVGSECGAVLKALNELPNDVIPEMQASMCTLTQRTNKTKISTIGTNNKWDGTDNLIYDGARPIEYPLAMWLAGADASNELDSYSPTSFALAGYVYRIHFNNNPGKIRQPEIDIYLDGIRPTVASDPDNTDEIITRVWTDGQQGESVDYFGDHCDGVTVTLNRDIDGTYLGGLTPDEKALLKACLGTSDFDDNNNVDVYNWDHGSEDYPHIIKLVLSVTSTSDGGYYAALYSDGTNFYLLNNPLPQDREVNDQFEVYTTKGVLARTSNKTEANFGFASNTIVTANVTWEYDDSRTSYDGDISCEVNDNNVYHLEYVAHCVNKSDIITFLNFDNRTINPPYLNLYTVDKIYTSQYQDDDYSMFPAHTPHGWHYGSHIIKTDLATNWATDMARTSGGDDSVKGVSVNVYKFFPNSESSYTYVAQCSNRGLCNEEEGLCECFKGYTGDACQTQASIAV